MSICAAAGMAHQDIADTIGIAKATLYVHFPHELSTGALVRRAEVVEAMHRQAKAGNVAAGKAFLAMEPRVTAPPAPPDPPLGKKQQAAVDAKAAHVGTAWGDDLDPTAQRSVQ